MWNARGRNSRVGAIRSKALERMDDATGVLVPAGDSNAMAEAVVALITNGESRRYLGENAWRDARERFDLNRQVEGYLAWFRTIIDGWNGYAVCDAD